MEVKELLGRLITITGLSDFLIIKAGYNEEHWGCYYKRNKVVVIYNLDEHGIEYPEWQIVKTACHELAHHIQIHHSDVKEKAHGEFFQDMQIHLLSKFYIDEGIPQEILDQLKEEGFKC